MRNENPEKIFQWKFPEDEDSVNVLEFIGMPGLKIDMQGHDAYDYFKIIFSDEVHSLISNETNRFAEQVLDLRPEESGKRKYSPEWTKTTNCEIKKFLGIILLVGHTEKDKLQGYWSTNELIEKPIFQKKMLRNRFFENLKFLHFSNDDKKISKTFPDYDRFWKL